MPPLPSSEDSTWFAKDVQPHEAELRAYLRRNFPGTTDVDDVIQESYLRLLQQRGATPIRSPKAYLFATARKTEEAGSLTIIASVLVETGSRMDDVIFQEFKGTGNMELVLDRKCAEMRLWPAINVASSGTRKEELLIDAKDLEGIHFFRRALVQQKIEEATETMIARLSKTKTNAEFLKLIAQ